MTIGGVTVPPSFSGLTSFVGLYQVNVQVPSETPTGDAVPLVLTIGGTQSNLVTIAVGSPSPPTSNPAPTITSLSPTSIPADSIVQTLIINGTGFTAASTVSINGVVKTMTFVSGTRLTTQMTDSDLGQTGSYPVVVTNPAPGGGTSNVLSFLVVAPPPDDGDDDDY